MNSLAAGNPIFVISAEFLHGTFRGDPTGSANTGRLEKGEWPPSPARLFAALVAADGTGNRCRATQRTGQSELKWLEEQPPPIIYADAPTMCRHQQLNPRYVVLATKSCSSNTHQEFVGRKGSLVRPGVRVAPRHPHAAYLWESSPPSDLFDALRLRCARVGYLGTSDSPVRLRAGSKRPDHVTEDSYKPARDGTIAIGVPAPGQLAVLDRMYDEWSKLGPSISRSQYPALNHSVWYREPVGLQQFSPGEVVAWLRISRKRLGGATKSGVVSGRRVSIVTDLFKKSLLSKYDDLFGDPPPILHGHGFSGNGYELARYLALPDVGFKWSRGCIHGLALWLPSAADGRLRKRARDAALAIRRISGNGIDVLVARTDVRDKKDRPLAANPWRWEKESIRWATAFPAVHERRCRLNLDEVSKWCIHAGLPKPVAFRSTRSPLVHGALDLAPVEVNRPGRIGMPYSHVELVFSEPVKGPIVIGSGRQRGLGLCVPVREKQSNA